MKRVSSAVANAESNTGGSYKSRVVQRFGDRRITLYRRADIAEGSWFLCLYLREEKRQYRVSLKTDSLERAKRAAEDLLIDLLGRVRSGERVLSPTLSEVLRQYHEDQAVKVRDGQLSAKTVLLHSYRIKLGLAFLGTHYPSGLATNISAIDGSRFEGYLAWRQRQRAEKSTGGTIRLDVVRDELLSIRKVFKFAREKKLCAERNVPVWNFAVEREGPKRRRITQENYSDFINCIKSWKGQGKSPKDSYHRQLLFHFVLIVSNTGLRTGELLGLRNRDVEVRSGVGECVLTVRAATSKVRRGRQITVNQSFGGHPTRAKGVNYLIRWMSKYQIHKDPGDFVFAPHGDGKTSARDIYYHTYKLLRNELKTLDLDWFDTYHCRHFWITNRLYAGEPIHLVARAAGTSTDEIERTYSNVLTEMTTRQFGKRRAVFGRDGTMEVVSADPKTPEQ